MKKVSSDFGAQKLHLVTPNEIFEQNRSG